MSLTVDDIYTLAKTLIRKNQAGGLDSVEFATHWNDAQSTYFNDLVGPFQAKNTGKEGLNTGLIKNQTIMGKLMPFVKPTTITATSGNTPKPADFQFTLALRISGIDVIQIDHDQIGSVSASVITPPSTTRSFYVEYLGYYLILPITYSGSVSLDYVCTPADILWNFTLDGSNRKVYSSSGSVQPQWDALSNREITKRMLKTLGISFKDSDFANFGATVQATSE